MAKYEKLSLVKRSIYDFLKAELENAGYTFGDEAGEISFRDAYPRPEEKIKLPCIAMDFEGFPEKEQVDLGTLKRISVAISLYIYERDNLKRERLSNIIKDSLEEKMIPLIDYNLPTPTEINKMKVTAISVSPNRDITVGDEQKFGTIIDFDVEFYESN